ncbi:MAG: hypothetical protein ACI9S8_000124 [Chlamydiales bacterium]|jgi:hypothetical protein
MPLYSSEKGNVLADGVQYLSTPETYVSRSDKQIAVFLAGSAAFPWRMEFEKK